MIDHLTISFVQDGLTYDIDVPTDDDNVPYYLASALIELIKKSGANGELVADQLKAKFNHDR